MAPDRQSDLAQVAFRAFIAGSTASFINACVAGQSFDPFQLAVSLSFFQFKL